MTHTCLVSYHDWCLTTFNLVVANFGIRYIGEVHAKHLLDVLQNHYNCTADWTGNMYISLTLYWDYMKREVHLFMPGYVANALKEFEHDVSSCNKDKPHPHTPPTYGATKQYVTDPNSSPSLDAKGKEFIQKVNGKFLYLG